MQMQPIFRKPTSPSSEHRRPPGYSNDEDQWEDPVQGNIEGVDISEADVEIRTRRRREDVTIKSRPSYSTAESKDNPPAVGKDCTTTAITFGKEKRISNGAGRIS